MALQTNIVALNQLTADPSSPADGSIWYNTTDQKLRVARGGQIQDVDDLKNKFDATSYPTASDDSTADYEVGSVWVNVTSDEAFVCADATAAAAVWKTLTGLPGLSTGTVWMGDGSGDAVETNRSGIDDTAIHDDVAGEIAAVSEKTTPVSGDMLLIEDSADANNKKRVLVGNLPTGGGGEANTASNAGTGGVGITLAKTGIDLPFKSINAGSAKVTVTDDAGNKNVDIDVVDATTTQKGAVELATDGESAADVVVQGNDSRLSDSRAPTGAAGGDLGGTYPSPTVNDGADGSAIHDDVSGEIAAIALKGTPVSGDLLVIEDSAASNAKKRITVGSLPSGGSADIDIQGVNSTNNTTTTSATFVDVPGATLTTAGSGSKVYKIMFDGAWQNTSANVTATLELMVDGVSVTDSDRASGLKNAANAMAAVTSSVQTIAPGKVIKTRWKTDGGTLEMIRGCLTIVGVG